MYRALLAAAFQRTTEAARHIQTALELEPVSAILHAIAGNIWSVIAQDDRSLQCARRAVELDPTLLIARRLRALAEVVSGDRELAVIDAERAVAEGGGTADLLGALGVVYARVNRWAEAERVLDDLIARRTQQYIAPLLIADICAALDRRDDACVWLERASEERNGLVTEIAAAPHYGRLRDEPRFRALLRRMNLPEPA